MASLPFSAYLTLVDASGIITPWSGPDAPLDTFQPVRGMLVFNHSSNQITRQENVLANDINGYWHGRLQML